MRIAFIGSVGIPNCYGGFESFLEACGPVMSAMGHEVHVSCDADRYEERAPFWNGVRRHFIPLPANKASSIFHDLLAFLSVFWRVDLVVVLGVSGGPWFPLMRLLCTLFRTRLAVNIDGVEYRRGGSKLKCGVLFLFDFLAQLFSHWVVYDNEALRPFVIAPRRAKSLMIPYSGDQTEPSSLGLPGEPLLGTRCLTICRIEPENNCHLLLEAALQAGVGEYVFIGNWKASKYGMDLYCKFATAPGIRLLDPIYEPASIAEYRRNCTIYLHGHSVGGTNPSLVEMLFFDCEILAFDCAFNRATAGVHARYFRNVEELVEILDSWVWAGAEDRSEVRNRYSRASISKSYLSLL